MVMSFGTLVVVLEPQELKDMVREWAQSTAELYKE
jgi:predicted DNA-binding transcriptional regulator YafY